MLPYKTKLEMKIVFEAINQTKVCVSDNPINLLLTSSFDKKSKRKEKIQILNLTWSFLCLDLDLVFSSKTCSQSFLMC